MKKKEKLRTFLNRLENEEEITSSGKIEGNNTSIEYTYSTKLGLKIGDFPVRRGFSRIR